MIASVAFACGLRDTRLTWLNWMHHLLRTKSGARVWSRESQLQPVRLERVRCSSPMIPALMDQTFGMLCNNNNAYNDGECGVSAQGDMEDRGILY